MVARKTVAVAACVLCEGKPQYGSDDKCANCRRNYERMVIQNDMDDFEVQMEKTHRKLTMLNNIKKIIDERTNSNG
mgnify:CR=1 FL=1